MVSGATPNKAGHAAATRAENQRRVADLIEKAPPMKDKSEYNGGLGKAAKLSTEEWLSGLTEKGSVPVDDKAWQAVANGYDWTCGMQPTEDFMSEWGSTLREGRLFQREKIDHFVVSLVMRKRAAGYWSERIEPPAFRPLPTQLLPQDLQAAGEVKPQAGKTRIIRNGTELQNPEWRPNRINGTHDLHYETNHGIDGAKYVPASINHVIIEHLIRTGGLTFEGDLSGLPDWARALLDEMASRPAPSNEDVMTAALEAKYPVKPESIDGLVEAIEYAVKFPNKPEALNLTDGFKVVEQDDTLRITHVAMPGLSRVVGVKLVSGVYGRAIQRGEVRELLIRLKEANTVKRSAASGGMKTIGQVMAEMKPPVREAVSVPAVTTR